MLMTIRNVEIIYDHLKCRNYLWPFEMSKLFMTTRNVYDYQNSVTPISPTDIIPTDISPTPLYRQDVIPTTNAINKISFNSIWYELFYYYYVDKCNNFIFDGVFSNKYFNGCKNTSYSKSSCRYNVLSI